MVRKGKREENIDGLADKREEVEDVRKKVREECA